MPSLRTLPGSVLASTLRSALAFALATATSVLIAPSSARAGTLSPREIAKKAAESGAPDAVRQTMTMTLRDAKGVSTTRSLTLARRTSGAKGDAKTWSTRLEFLSPKDVTGTVLLSLDRTSGGADQYLYLPGLKRTRRLGGSQKSSAFQGSDFAYEDLASRDIDAADYRALPDEKVGADECWQIEATPKKGVDTGYGRTIADVRKSDFLAVRVRYFDPKGVELKLLVVDPSKLKIDGETRIPLRLEMTTLKDGHATVLDVTNVEINPKLEDSIFESASLDKG